MYVFLVSSPNLDIGCYIEVHSITDDLKYKLLVSPFKPDKNYNFKKDLDPGAKRGPFVWSHLDRYPWMVYSPTIKGILCKYCVLFCPTLKRGKFGSFIKTGFKKYYQIHDEAKKHVSSRWHTEATTAATFFENTITLKKKNVFEQINTAAHKIISDNRVILKSITQTLIFCGTHDISIRGKESDSGNFQDLLKLRMEAEDTVLTKHFETCSSNSKYTSHRIQNELISICGNIICNEIVKCVNDSMAFSLMADESADIAGKEQLSIGVRYVTQTYDIKEEFLGFVELQKLNAEAIATSIIQFTSRVGLDMSKLVGLGFDGCSTMSGKENGVQAIIKKQYPIACFFHCASHKLNLVVNDQNSLPEIRNSIGTIKETIKFFRESILRRRLISNIPLLCETRWSEKYKSIRIFDSNFFEIKSALSKLATNYDTNSATRTKAYQLSCATSTIGFIVCLKIITKYSKILEPIVNKLQAVNTNLHTVHQHIHSNLLEILKKHRSMPEENFSLIFNDVRNCAIQFNLDIQIPRVVSKQIHRQNIVASTPDEYFRISIYIPYIDSLIQSLEIRFSPINEIQFKLGFLHPSTMLKMTKINFIDILKEIDNYYKIENLVEEGQTWYDYWEMMKESSSINEKENVSFFFKDCEFYPTLKKSIIIYMTIPPTTCSAERTFSTLRRVKTWLR